MQRWYCADEATVMLDSSGAGTKKTFSLSKLSRLGDCSSQPLAGKLDFCSGEAACGGANISLTSTLSTGAFQWLGFGATTRVGVIDTVGGTAEVYGLVDIKQPVAAGLAAFLWLPPGTPPQQIWSSQITLGAFVFGSKAPDANGAYCATAGVVSRDDTRLTFSLTELRPLGHCGETPIEGQLDGVSE
jgi:hypothetical protein